MDTTTLVLMRRGLTISSRMNYSNKNTELYSYVCRYEIWIQLNQLKIEVKSQKRNFRDVALIMDITTERLLNFWNISTIIS